MRKILITIMVLALSGCATQRESQITGAAIGAAIGTAIASPDTAMLGAIIGAAVGARLGAESGYPAHVPSNPYQVCDRYWHRVDRNRCIQDIRMSRGG